MNTHDNNKRSTASWPATAAICGGLLLLVAAVFGQIGCYEFINCDDPVCVYQNPHVVRGPTAREIGWVFTNRYADNYVPLTWISHMVDWGLFGSWAGGHHLTNVLLHAVTAVLLFLVLRLMTGRLWPSALAAAIFAVHTLACGIGWPGSLNARMCSAACFAC